MIVPMKKAAVIIKEEDSQHALDALRSLGVMHVEHQEPPSGKDIISLKDDVAILDKAIVILSSPDFRGKSGLSGVRTLKDWRWTAKHILDAYARIDHLAEYSKSLLGNINEWDAWGDFNPETIAQLRKEHIYIKLYHINLKDLEVLRKEAIVKVINSAKGMAFAATISRSDRNFPYKELTPPKIGLMEMKARLLENEDIMRSLKEMIRKYACYLQRFIEIHKAFGKELEFHEALRGMGRSGALSYLVGYIPAEKVKAVTDLAREESWGLLVNDPSQGDNVPTFIRNPYWVSIISPIFKLIEIVPGYHEMDISPAFLLFLSLFFGMIIGDAGYGTIYILLTFIFQKKFGAKMKDHRIFYLLYLFSAAAVFWGLLTGTIFGQEWYLKAGFKAFVPILNDTKFLQAFCFFIGALHLTIAQAWQGLRKIPSLKAFADLGWISILWAAFFLACMLILNDPLPGFTRWLLIIGSVFVIFFSNPQKNLFKTISSGLGAIALNIMNNFTDVVSYIRLFAVGLAGVAISDTVNSLAASLSGGNFLIHFAIVFSGHTINILLGPMSVLVHGIRLNVLEFSGHAGLSWGGIKYKPLENTQK